MSNLTGTIPTRPVALTPLKPSSGNNQGNIASAVRQVDSASGKPLPGTTDVTSSEASQPPVEEVSAAAISLSNLVQNQSRELRFSVDEFLGRIVVTVLDSVTDQVIRQIPSEEVVEMAKALELNGGSLPSGMLINREA